MDVKHPCQYIIPETGQKCGLQADGRTIVDQDGKPRPQKEHRCILHVHSTTNNS